MTQWRPIPGWETLYEVSDDGVIRSIGRYVRAKNNKRAFRKGRVLAQVRKTNGYLCVTLTDGRRRPQLSVHALVARAFLGERPLGLHVLHGDGDKSNNSINNLRYGTPAENIADTARHGRRPRGENSPHAKLTEAQVHAIRAWDGPLTDLVGMYPVSREHLYAIRVRRVWRHI